MKLTEQIKSGQDWKKRQDKEKAKSPAYMFAATFDLQSVLYTPYLGVTN